MNPFLECVIVIILFAVAWVCYSTGDGDANHRWERDAVKQGYAHYDTTNGAWTWNNGSGIIPKNSTP